MSVKYVSIGKPIQVKSFERFKAPLGWIRQDILLKKLKTDKLFRTKFLKTELKELGLKEK